MNRRLTVVTAFILIPLLGIFLTRTCSSQTVYLRSNQTHYSPSDTIDLMLLSTQPLNTSGWALTSESSQYPLKVSVAGQFNNLHAYRMITSIPTPGSYSWKTPIRTSKLATVQVAPQKAKDLILTSLKFFAFQRCGTVNNIEKHKCHSRPSLISNSGSMDLSGGWHDAGDYLKFTITSGFATSMLLTAAQMTTDMTLKKPLIDEALWGLRWLEKTWVPGKGIYYQVGDASDHESWRLPQDTDREPTQKAFLTQAGRGANLAGKISASFALAAKLMIGRPDLQKKYRNLAIEIFNWGELNRAPQSSTDSFYVEETWKDDMALAALELYHLTGLIDYLKKARQWLRSEGNGWAFSYDRTHSLALYKWGLYSPGDQKEARNFLVADLKYAQASSQKNLFNEGVAELYWGSSLPMMGSAITALLFEKINGGRAFRGMAQLQRDYLLGRNPWGVSFLATAGHRWTQNPHHQIANIRKIAATGSWNAGPLSRKNWKELRIGLSRPDPYEDFQSETAVFHDDKNDYATNEPTIAANATGILMLMGFLSSEISTHP